MISINARQALLANGWRSDVRVDIDKEGFIVNVVTNANDNHCQPGDQALPGKHDLLGQATPKICDCEKNTIDVGILLPAPVNLHSHTFQRAMRGLTETRSLVSNDSFWTWRALMYRFVDQLTPDQVQAIASMAQMEMLEAGFASYIEFHYLHHQPDGKPYSNVAELAGRIAAATSDTGIGLTLLPVHYQYGGVDKRSVSDSQRRFMTTLDCFSILHEQSRQAMACLPDDCGVGLAAHSLRAIDVDKIQQLLQVWRNGPVHMHVAEQQAEVEEIRHHLKARPVEWLLDNVALDKHWCLVHCTHMTDSETRRLADTQAVVGLCPITEANLGDGIFNGSTYMRANGKLGIGSDANVRISLCEELRTLEYSQRLANQQRAVLAEPGQSTGRCLFDQVLEGGACASGRNTGVIEAGFLADLIALDDTQVDLASQQADRVLDAFVFSGTDTLVQEVWSAGRHQVRQGLHVNRAAIVEQYLMCLEKLLQHL